MIDLMSIVNGLKPLTVVYSVFAVGYVVARVAFTFRKRPRVETYILSDSKGHTVKVTWDSSAPAEERARVLKERVHSLEAKTA